MTLGGTAPVVVQSMTNTDTADGGNGKQVAELARAGSELVRITVNTGRLLQQLSHQEALGQSRVQCAADR